MTWKIILVWENLKFPLKGFQFVMSLKIGGSWRTLSAMLRYPCVIFYYHSNQRIANCCAWFLDIPMTWLWSQYDAMFIMVIDLWRHWYMSMADSICHAPPIFNDITNWNFFSTETSDFLKQIFLKWVYIFHHPRMHVMSIWCHTDVNLVSSWVRCYIIVCSDMTMATSKF